MMAIMSITAAMNSTISLAKRINLRNAIASPVRGLEAH
jgi:hypothetical protein